MTISKEHWRNYTDREKRQGIQEKPVCQNVIFPLKNFTRTGQKSSPDHLGQKTATNRLSN